VPADAAVSESRAEALRRGSEVLASLPEAEQLLRFVLDCSRTQLYGGLRQPLLSHESEAFERVLSRRLDAEPLQYITGTQSFRNLQLRVGPGVLVPRPETELLVEEALALLGRRSSPLVVDVGTGSGAIALSIAIERPSARVWATEISEEALVWARRNLAASKVELLQGDLLSPMPAKARGTVHLIVSNPPYLSEAEWRATPADVRHHEPAIALKSERQGLELTERLIREALHWLAPQGWLILETSPSLAEDVRRLLWAGYEEVAILDDLAGRPRIARGRRP
jgi:release factor glutamine methyltransferase